MNTNLKFDNNVWMFIFIVGFVMVLLTSKCLCNNEQFIEIEDGTKPTTFTIKLENGQLLLCDSSNKPLKINGSNIIINENRVKTIADLKTKLDKSSILNMFFINNKGTNISLILFNFTKNDISVNNNIIQIKNAKFKKI
jgi:hypothetical protein